MRRSHPGCSIKLRLTPPRSVPPPSQAPHPSHPALAVESRSGIGIHQGEGPPPLSKRITDHPCPLCRHPCKHQTSSSRLGALILAGPSPGKLSPPELHMLGLLPSHVTTRVPSLTNPPKGTCLPTSIPIVSLRNVTQAVCLPRRGTPSYALDASVSFAGRLLSTKAARPCRHIHQTTRPF